MIPGDPSAEVTSDTAITAPALDGSAPGERHWTWQDVTLDDVYAARERIMPYLHRTPMMTSHTLNQMTNTDLMLKAELFQKTGSFKSRGALNAAMQLTDEQRARGIVTMSAGNHGQGIAFAASLVGARAVVFMPESAVPTKVDAIRGYGAEAKFAPTIETLSDTMEAYQREHGLTFISPFADPAIIAGSGSVGLEILEDCPDVETIVVPVGGGGLISGIAVAVKSLRPDVRIVGVEPEGANVVTQSLKSGKLERPMGITTIADGLAAPYTGALNVAIIEHYVDDIVLVSDDEIAHALRLILSRTKLMTEPAGSAATAALLSGKCGVRVGGRTVVILSGGNIDETKLCRLIGAQG